MQVSSKIKSPGIAVFIAASITLVQPLTASANSGHGLGDFNCIIAGISSPSAQDDVLYRPRWSLPPNGVLKKLPLHDEDSDDSPVETTEKKPVETKEETPVKTPAVKKPAISRSERLNLGQSQNTSEGDDSAETHKAKIVTPDTKTVSKESPAPSKRTTPAVNPQPTQAPAPTVSAPIPGAFIMNHMPGSVATNVSTDPLAEPSK